MTLSASLAWRWGAALTANMPHTQIAMICFVDRERIKSKLVQSWSKTAPSSLSYKALGCNLDALTSFILIIALFRSRRQTVLGNPRCAIFIRTFDRRLKIFEILVPNCIYFKNIQQKHDIELFNKLKAHHTSTAYASDICLEPVHLYEWFQIINPQLIRYFCHLLLFKLTPQSSAAQGQNKNSNKACTLFVLDFDWIIIQSLKW